MTQKKKREPPPAGKGTLIGLRLQPGPLARVDRWAASQKDDPSRPEAIRRLVELGLARTERAGARTKKAAKASEMASQEIDRLGDPSATEEERQLRKRRLIRGPKEFRDSRRNRPKANERSTDIPMPSHKFQIGETVYVRPAISRNVPGGAYAVTKQLPHNGREFEYRIKSASEEHERVVRESELTKA